MVGTQSLSTLCAFIDRRGLIKAHSTKRPPSHTRAFARIPVGLIGGSGVGWLPGIRRPLTREVNSISDCG